MVRIRSLVAAVPAVIGSAWIARAVWGIPAAMGASADAIVAAVPKAGKPTRWRYRERRFHNTEPSSTLSPASTPTMIANLLTRGGRGRPAGTIPMATPLAPADAADLAVTWYGHATVILEIDGHRVLTDPVWSERVSPSAAFGPARMHPVPAPVAALPALDAIVISHDHYDHLDKPTVEILVETQDAPFLVPLGIGAHLRRWGVPAARIMELGWGDVASVGELTIACAEARHFSGRGFNRDNTLWASWVVAGRARRAYFGGDTGYTKAFAEIAADYGPFDVTLLPVGAYNDMWPDIHMNPEEAVRAHTDLNGAVLVPVHWATFNLAFHSWVEPVRRLVAAAAEVAATLAIPMPGQRLDLSRTVPVEPWWENVSA